MPKASKASVKYGAGMAAAHCAICVNFRAPDGCAKVAGTISPRAWCSLFKRRVRHDG